MTKARVGPRMVSEYVSYRPPTNVGMTMVEGPWFFASFGGGWRFKETTEGTTEAVWKYTYSVRPSWLRFVAEPIGQWLLGRQIRARIAAFGGACHDPPVIAAVPARPTPGTRRAAERQSNRLDTRHQCAKRMPHPA